MISTKNLVKLANKWRRVAAASRNMISLPRSNSTKSSGVAHKGQFVVYTADQRRFALPLAYLGSQVVRELLRMAEEEFGLPCDSDFMEYAISVIQHPHHYLTCAAQIQHPHRHIYAITNYQSAVVNGDQLYISQIL